MLLGETQPIKFAKLQTPSDSLLGSGLHRIKYKCGPAAFYA